jgi:pre-rRNA-processing protein IPI3
MASPPNVLTRHIDAVTAVACGRASSSAGVSETIYSAARDKTVVTWELLTGNALRTFVFSAVPKCIAIDPAERALYVGLETGGIQPVELLRKKAGGNDRNVASILFEEQFRDVPVTVDDERWGGGEYNENAVLAVAVCFEGNLVIGGDEKGTVGVWDVATGCLFKRLCSMKGNVTLDKNPPFGVFSCPFLLIKLKKKRWLYQVQSPQSKFYLRLVPQMLLHPTSIFL